MSRNDGEIVIGTKLDDSEFSSGISKLGGTATKAMAAVTAAIGAASVAIISLGSEFEAANAKASTLFGDANVNMSQYGTDMLALSTKTGLAASELGNTMYDALSAGIPASDDMSEAMSFLEKNTKLAKAGFTDINTATTATAKVLNSYKMDVSETDRVHKILMQTQNKGIVTVNELGSVLSQVTPTASAMNVSFEQVGAALANMTAQGTPAAQATTQLNQLLAELGKSGTIANESLKAATEGTKYAGKSFQDLMKEGVPLNEILDLIDGTAKNNGKSMLDMFSSIESGKAALALSGQNSKQYADNLKEMGTSADVVGDAYEKVTNTFEEKSKKVVNSLKNVGIAAYDKFKEPLTRSMDAAQKSIDGLSKDMSNGKLGESVDKIAESFGKLIEITIEIAAAAIPLLLNGFSFIVDNGEMVAAAIAGISAAMLIYNNYQAISTALHKAGAIASATYSVAQAVLSGNVTLATGAMALFNTTLLANPIGLAVAAVGALVAAVAVLSFTTGEEKTATQELSDEIDKQTESIKENEKALKDKEKAAATEVDNIGKMKQELDTLVDANGEVKAGYESRAKYLTNELAQATGIDIQLTGDQIVGYDALSASIDKVIEKMRAEAIMEARKEEYSKNLGDQKTALEKLNEATEEYNKQIANSDEWINNYAKSIRSSSVDEATARNKAGYAWEKYEKDMKTNIDKAQGNYDDYTKKIIAYEQGKTDIINGEYDKVNNSVNANSSVYEQNIAKKKELMSQEISDLSTNLGTLRSIRTEDNAQTVDAQIASEEKSRSQKALDLWALNNVVWNNSPLYEEAYAYLSEQGAKAFDENGNLTDEAQAKVDSARNGVIGWASNYNTALQELADNAEAVFDASGNLTIAAQKKILDAKVKTEEFSPQYVDALKKMADAGENIYDTNGNLTIAAQKKVTEAYIKVNDLTGSYKTALLQLAEQGALSYDVNGNLTEEAKKKVDDARKKIDEQNQPMKTAGKGLADKTAEGYKSGEFESSGKFAGEGLARGASSKGTVLRGAGASLAAEFLAGVKSKGKEGSPWKTTIQSGKWASEGLAIGAKDNQDMVNDAASDLVDGFLNTVNDGRIENTLSDILSTMDPSKIEEIVASAENAVNNNHLVFERQAKINAEYEVGKAVLQFQNQEIKVIGTLKAIIENHVNIDGRETAVALTPLIAEELAFE